MLIVHSHQFMGNVGSRETEAQSIKPRVPSSRVSTLTVKAVPLLFNEREP